MSDDVCLLSIRELSDGLRRRSISPLELIDAHLARIERLDGSLQSYMTVTAERARAEARTAEEEIGRGAWRGPLHGIPIGLKDLFDTDGIATTASSRLLLDRVPEADATVVRRLTDAGAILLGKHKMHEFAIGTARLEDAIPPPRNPWDPERSPGGSSSGSAAAVAAGLSAGAIGSDTGGSIRQPSSYCGIVGLKPTYGRVSRRGVLPLSWSLDHAGPMTRTVGDAGMLLQTIAGHDAADPASARQPVPDYAAALTGSLRGLRIGVPTSFIESRPEVRPEVAATFLGAVAVLRELGADVRDVVLPHVEHAETIQATIMYSEAAAIHEPWLRARRHEYSRGFLERVLPGLAYSAIDYVQALRGRELLCRGFDEMMATIDLIANPSTPRTAPSFAEQAVTPTPRGPFTRIFNLTGQPSISVPCGADRDGLPIGVMLSGRAFDESTVLRAADAFERATDWHRRHPTL